ncbi:MAG: phage virion morphogenesis protein [Flavobacteriales bacterium]|nr:phage virion morphogenesis protein [Flavobacteriales bacterium]
MPVHSTHKLNPDSLRKLFRDIPRVAGTEAVNHFKSHFRLGGFYDDSLRRWRPRKPNAKRNNGRGLLMNTGALRRSIRVIRTTPEGVTVGSDLPYAKAHNEGAQTQRQVTVRTHARKAHTRSWKGKKQDVQKSIVDRHQRSMNINLPQRKFIGNSQWLNRKISIRIIRLMRNTL